MSTPVSISTLSDSNIVVTKPESIADGMASFVSLEEKPEFIFVLVSNSVIHSILNNDVTINHSEFSSTIQSLENKIAKYMHENSEKLFDNKRFSLHKMQSSLFSITDNDSIHLKVVPESQIKDQFGNSMNFSDVVAGMSCTLVLCLQGIRFTKTSWSLVVNVHQFKIFKNASIDTWAIPDVSDTHTVDDEITSNESNNDDNQEFF